MKNYTTKIARAKENADKAQKIYDEACKRRNDAGIALDKDAYEAANVQVQIAHEEWQNALREYDNVVKDEVANYCEDDNNDTEDNAEAMANIEIKIAKNGSKRYYVRDDNGKLSQISREKAYELQIEADNKIMANLFEQTAEKEMTDIEQANYIARVDIDTVGKTTVQIKYAINLDTAAKFIRLCGNTFGERLIYAEIRDTKGSTVNTEAETTTEVKSMNTEKKLYKVFNVNHDDEVPQETATKLDIIIDEKRINVSMNVNRKTLKSAYKVFTKALEQAVADGVISVKTAQFGNFADDINDIDFNDKNYVEFHDSVDNSFAYGIDDNGDNFYIWFWATAEGENDNTDGNEITTTENKPTRRELEIEKKIIMDEIDEAREGLIEAEADTEIPQSHIDYLKDIIDTRIKDYYEVCAKLDELNDDLPPENNTDAERETANVESTTATDTTPEYKYYIKSRRPIFGAAPNGYIKAVSGEVHEPVRRPNGTYSPKCRIYFATVIYDKPLTDEQIINYDLAVSNETFELLNAATAEGENGNTDDNEVCTAIEKSDAKETYKRVNKVLSIGLKYVTTKQGRHMWYCNGTLINKSLASAVLAAHGFTPEEFIAAKKVADEYFLEIEIPRRYAIRKQAKHLWDKIDRDCKPSAEPMPALFPAEDSDNDDEPPPTDKVITPDEMLAIVGTLDTVNASAPAGWQIDYNGKNFPVKFNGKTVANLDSLALTKILPPDKFFDRFKPDVPPKEQYINERRKELDMLLGFRKFVEDDPDRLKTLANLIEDVKREILDAELDTEHPPDFAG